MASNPLGDAIIWTDDPAEFTIKDGIASCRIRSGNFMFELRSTIAVMRKGLRSGQAALAMHDTPPRVVEFPPRHN